MSPWHVAIYYATDHGNYILYKEYVTAPETYLFPLDDFYLYAESVVLSKGDGYSDGGVSNDESFDLESYLFEAKPQPDESDQQPTEPAQQPTEPAQQPNLFMAIITTGLVLFVVCAAAFVFSMQQRNLRPETVRNQCKSKTGDDSLSS